MNCKTLLWITIFTIKAAHAAVYSISATNAGVNMFTGNSCQRISQADMIPMWFSYTDLLAQGATPAEINGTYSVNLVAPNINIGNSAISLVRNIFFQGQSFDNLAGVQWDTSQSSDNPMLIYFLNEPVFGFKSGVYTMTALFIKSNVQIYIDSYKYTANPSSPVAFNAGWSKQFVGTSTNQTINITLPCSYLPKATGFSISFPVSNSSIALGYYFNPLAYFDSMNCGLLINGILPLGTTCSVSGGTLTVKNFLPGKVTTNTFNIFLQNLRIPPTHLGPINMTWFEGSTVSAPFLRTVVNNTNTSGLFCLFGNFTYSPTKINMPNLMINFTVSGNLKFPYLPGYYMKIKFIDDWIPNQPITVTLLNKYNQNVETGTAKKVNGEYIYTLQTEFLMDAGIYGTLSGFNTPYIDKTYYVITSFWSDKQLQIAQYSNNTITFTN